MCSRVPRHLRVLGRDDLRSERALQLLRDARILIIARFRLDVAHGQIGDDHARPAHVEQVAAPDAEQDVAPEGALLPDGGELALVRAHERGRETRHLDARLLVERAEVLQNLAVRVAAQCVVALIDDDQADVRDRSAALLARERLP